MSEVMKGDSAIKLFGKIIVTVQRQSSSQDTKGTSTEETFTDTTTLSGDSDDPKGPSPTKDSSSQNTFKDEQELSESINTSQDKTTTKKPEKILLCPRCKSMDTKFCYYNNYNVNQPRYFCKNCQRYWTSGGAMRNVPIGSGRRKNKIVPIPNYRHMMIHDGIDLSSTRPNGFLIFDSDHTSYKPSGPLGLPITFYPSMPFWGTNVPCNGSILGKHSREGVMFGQSDLRKGSLSDKEGSMSVSNNLRFGYGADIFKAFGPKGATRIESATTILEANPAALSRSLNFREKTY